VFYRRQDDSFHLGFTTDGQGNLLVAALGLEPAVLGRLAEHGEQANGDGFGYLMCPVNQPGGRPRALFGNHPVAVAIRAMNSHPNIFGANPEWQRYCDKHGVQPTAVKVHDDPDKQGRHWPPRPEPDTEEPIPQTSTNSEGFEMDLNTILYGPPGTGKTFATTALALAVIEPAVGGAASYAQGLLGAASDRTVPKIDKTAWEAWINEIEDLRAKGRIEFTTFHQNYAYEDFIEGIRPEVKDGHVHYRVEPGALKRIAYRALYAWITGEVAPVDDAGNKKVEERVSKWLHDEEIDEAEAKKSEKDAPKYLLVIDEINRGNVSRILGELITLIEDSKRARRNPLPGQQPLKVTLPYTKQPFILPPNLSLLGTMNTADRSLVGLDLALRRRFSFEELEPKPELLGTCGDVDLNTFLTTLNKRIEEHLDRDHRIGHAFLMGPTDMEGLARVMRKKVIPQLMEYFHDRPDLLAKVLEGTGFVEFDNSSTLPRIKRIASEELSVAGRYGALKSAS